MHTLAAPSDAMPLHWAAELVKRMRALYGVKFDQAWANLDPKEIPTLWADQLAGMTGAEIATGLAACRDREWPPTIPEFRRLCRPWTDPEIAFYVAVKGVGERRAGRIGDWPHPAVYWAAVNVGAHDLANSGYSVLRGRWETALTAQLARSEWEAIPEPSTALPAPGQTVATREEALAQLLKVGAANVVNNRRNLLTWPKKILDKPSNYSPAVVAMARRAMGIEPEVA